MQSVNHINTNLRFRPEEYGCPLSISSLTERIAVGGVWPGTIEDVAGLAERGVTHTINMCAEAETEGHLFTDPRLTTLWLPQNDDGGRRPIGHYRRGIEFALKALAKPNTKVFCHCAQGINRGPTMAYALLRAFGISKEGTIALIRQKRPIVGFYNHKAYIDSVERELRGR